MLSNDDDDDDDSPTDTSLLILERAVADVELIQAAYPDEVEIIDPPTAAAAGSIIVQFHLSDTAHVCVEFPSGYPTKSALQIVSYRSQDKNKHRIERVVTVLRNVAQECWENECEGGLSCCAAALEAWNDIEENEQTAAAAAVEEQQHPQVVESSYTTFQWISGISITDRKSTFQAHACQVHTEADIRQALDQLMEGNGRIQKAYHNMVRCCSSCIQFCRHYISCNPQCRFSSLNLFFF